MKSQKTLMNSKSRRAFQYARRGALSGPGKFILATVMLAAMLVFTLLPVSGVPGQGQGQQDDPNSEIQQGFALAPVPLNLEGKNRALVGLGSYIVNAQSFCNGCHSTSANEWLPGGNPFLGQVEQIDQARYLVGGRQFGAVGVGPRSRNLTPDPVTGLPAGYTFEEFLHVLRTGEDLKHLAPFVPSAGVDLLQTMPWPTFRSMTDRDILAIYEYLSSVPSLPGFPQ